MAKLPSIRPRDMVRVAESIGFVLDRQRGSHAVYYRVQDSRRLVIPMHGSKDLKPGTLRGLIADMGLSIEESTSGCGGDAASWRARRLESAACPAPPTSFAPSALRGGLPPLPAAGINEP